MYQESKKKNPFPANMQTFTQCCVPYSSIGLNFKVLVKKKDHSVLASTRMIMPCTLNPPPQRCSEDATEPS